MFTEKQIREYKYNRGERPVCIKKCECIECSERIEFMQKQGIIFSLLDFNK